MTSEVTQADSGMDGQSVERAELVWANLPTNRPWASLPTYEKALVCHTLARLTAQSGEGRSGAGEDAALKLVAGYVDYTTESKDRWEQGKAAGYRELGSIVAAALNARQSGEGEREAKAIARFADAIGRLPFVSEALAKGYQFNAYESASNDDDAEDDEREYQICIGPVSDVRFICAIEGMAKADLIEAALKIAALRATDDAGGA